MLTGPVPAALVAVVPVAVVPTRVVPAPPGIRVDPFVFAGAALWAREEPLRRG